jgi:hypothetical protein
VARYRLPGAALHQVTHLNTYALPEAAPAAGDEPWPVLLCSHGYGLENAVSDSYLTEALASHGYVVISVSHPGESLATVFPDGTIAALDVDHPDLALAARLDEIEAAGGVWGPLAAESLNGWVEDLRCVLNELERLNAPGEDNPLAGLAGRLDLGRVGALGVGFGGSAAMALAAQDPRVGAAASLGGRIAPGAAALGARPSLLITGQGQTEPADWAPTQRYALPDASPLHFTGAALWFPQLAQVADFEAGNIYAHYKTLNAQTLGFFNQALRGQPGAPPALPAH